ncbi:MAG: hypothetical protein KBB01_07615 [Candidatus Omnitrophica bacterium]|nr:hypothetical protein [Candidatus Omnitrophota bacterium]
MKNIILVMILFISLFVITNAAYTHCDTLDGPVINDARIALERKDVTPVLKWVKISNEKEIKDAFNKTLAKITRNPNDKEAIEMEFFSELVRIHRAGEGASFEGLKPAGEVEPIVRISDEAIETGSTDELTKHINAGIEKRFNRVMKTVKQKDETVEKGREYVEAYVDFMHYVENIYNAALKYDGHHEHNEKTGESLETKEAGNTAN